MTRAYSTVTGKHYDSWEDLVLVEANGWSCVATVKHISRKTSGEQIACRVYGPYQTRREARNMANSFRRHWKNVKHHYESVELLKISVEPIWPKAWW